MKIKNIIKLISLLVITGFISSCGEYEPITFSGSVVAVEGANSGGTIVENASEPFAVTVVVSQAPKQDVNIPVEIEDISAIEGVDYILVDNKVTIKAGAYSGTLEIIPIDNDGFDESRQFIVKLSSAPTGYELSADIAITLSILNDDCPVNTAIWSGGVNIEDVGYGVAGGVGGPNDNGDCNVLVVDGDFLGAYATGITFQFTPAFDGATNGTVVAERQDYNCCSTEYEYEAEGTYDETTQEIIVNYLFYEKASGDLLFPGTNIITPQ